MPLKCRNYKKAGIRNAMLTLLVLNLLRSMFTVNCFVSNSRKASSTFSFEDAGNQQNRSPLFAKRKGKPGRRGRRGNINQELVMKENEQKEGAADKKKRNVQNLSTSLKKPSKTKKCWVRLERPSSSSALDVCLVEIQDAAWWEQENNVNPFGARLWPPSLALAKFLAKYPLDCNHFLLEVGCGTGLVSMVGACCGATSRATDISDMALSLTKAGWSETSRRLQKLNSSSVGNLTVSSFDMFSRDPLPFPLDQQADSSSSDDNAGKMKHHPQQSSSPVCILVASAVLYDATLSKAMAKRAMEACQQGAWVILADDDTGLREGGRAMFESEWKMLMEKKKVTISAQWTYETVQQRDVFGWADKKVQLLHLNRPN